MKRIILALITLTLAACASTQPNPASRKPAGQLIQGEYKKGELIAQCKQAIAGSDERYKAIVALKPEARTMETTILAVEENYGDTIDILFPLFIMRNLSNSEDTRKEAQECIQLSTDFSNDVFTRRDLYMALKDQKGRNADEQRLVKETLHDFERNGMSLPDEKLKQFRELSQKLDRLKNEFNKNINEDKSEALFTEAELDGVTPDYIKNLPRNEQGLARVPTRSSDFLEVMQRAHNPETRKKMIIAVYNVGGKKNIEVLEQALLLRQQLAALLGYKTWADYRTADYIAKNSANVKAFLGGLKAKLSAGNQADVKQLLNFKKEIEPGATTLEQWDLWYMPFQMRAKKMDLNLDEVREYFPADTVIQGMFRVYEELLSVTFREVPNVKAWDPAVRQFEVIDKKDGRTIAYFYLDLYGRDGKYRGAAHAALTKGRRLKDGSYSVPVSVLFANLSKGTTDKPALMTFGERAEVNTLFHEFGHAMHHTLTRAPYASLSGTAVKRDFVEAPSQMLENWLYDSKIVNRLSGHYLDSTKKIPAEMLKKLIEQKDFQKARNYTRQLLLGTFDFTINTLKGPVDTLKLYQKMYREITGAPQMPGVIFPASFGHLMGGYDAGYYGYLWSQVYAEDMFTVFQKEGLTSPVAGAKYRKYILERGNMEEPMELVTKFLGRKSNSKAFFKSLGIKN